MRSRFVRVRKPGKYKRRWCILGFGEPDLTEVERETPTVNTNTVLLGLQAIASHGLDLALGDIKNAFLQGGALGRSGGPLYAEPTDIEGIPKDAVIERWKYVYGLVDAPRRWFETLTGNLKTDLQGNQSRLVCSVFLWHGCEGELRGIMVIQVDDVACGGTPEWFQEVAQPLRDIFPFGSWQEKAGKYYGRQLTQQADGTITVSLRDRVAKMQTIPIKRERQAQPDEECTPLEIKQLRSVPGWPTGSRLKGDQTFPS